MKPKSILSLLFFLAFPSSPDGVTASDVCTDPTDLPIDSSEVLVGSASVVVTDDDVPGCSFVDGFPTAWYQVVGTGNVLTLSTCSSETQAFTILNVLVGDDDCNELDCAGIREISARNCQETTPSNLASIVEWSSVEGQVYRILVSTEHVGDIFGLTVTEQVPPINSICEGAITVVLEDEDNTVVVANTALASPGDSQDTCGAFETSRAIWYTIQATTKSFLTATTCTPETTFDTSMSVFVGDDCNELKCVGFNDDDAECGEKSTLTWPAEPGETYYMLVGGFRASSVGTFGLRVMEDPLGGSNTTTLLPPNDVCENAIGFDLLLVTDDSLLVGSTLNASTTAEGNACGASDGNSTTIPGVWYTIMGNGRAITASTCSNVTDYDARLDVFGGDSCGGDLECVARSIQDMTCDFVVGAQVVSWMSVPEETYYLFVHGNGTTGTFGLTVTGEDQEEGVPSNDMCMNAIAGLPSTAAAEGGVTATGSTVNATIDTGVVGSAFCGTTIDAPGVWYYVDGEGMGMRASTCTENTAYDTAISVFTTTTGEQDKGGCGDLICIGGDDDDFNCGDNQSASSVAWASETGRKYYILVHGGKAGAVGDFGLTVVTFEQVQNDECSETADPIPSDGSLIIGSTVKATIDKAKRVYHCGAFVGVGAGVWYRVIGTGELFTVSTCSSETDFNTALSVFTGSCSFDNSTCVGGNDDTYFCDTVPYGASEYSWPTTRDEVYYILVHAGYFADLDAGFLSAYGTFGLTVTATEALVPV
jgi:hypothetical protein